MMFASMKQIIATARNNIQISLYKNIQVWVYYVPTKH